MTKILLNHPTFTMADELSDICHPLETLKIDSFSHLRSEENGSFSFLATNPNFIDHYFKKKYFNNDIHTCDLTHFGNFVIWDHLPRTGKTLEMEKEVAQFGIKHTFTIIQRNGNENNFYHFSSSVDSKAFNQVYLANLDLLNFFINQFHKITRRSKALSNAYDLKFYIDKNAEGFSMEEDEFDIDKTAISHLKSKLILQEGLSCTENSINTSLSHLPRKNYELSNRETQCIRLLIRGKTVKEIGRILGLSHRTIESYVIKIKNKLGVTYKSELIDKVIDDFI